MDGNTSHEHSGIDPPFSRMHRRKSRRPSYDCEPGRIKADTEKVSAFIVPSSVLGSGAYIFRLTV